MKPPPGGDPSVGFRNHEFRGFRLCDLRHQKYFFSFLASVAFKKLQLIRSLPLSQQETITLNQPMRFIFWSDLVLVWCDFQHGGLI
jgi:hypothetical protein